MTVTKVLNCRLNETLSNKFDMLKSKTGYDSDSECLRYLINISFNEQLDRNLAVERFNALTDEMTDSLIKLDNKGYKFQSAKEQLRNV